MSFGFIKNTPLCLDDTSFIYKLMSLFQQRISKAPDEPGFRGEHMVVFHCFSDLWGVPPLQQLCHTCIHPCGSS